MPQEKESGEEYDRTDDCTDDSDDDSPGQQLDEYVSNVLHLVTASEKLLLADSRHEFFQIERFEISHVLEIFFAECIQCR